MAPRSRRAASRGAGPTRGAPLTPARAPDVNNVSAGPARGSLARAPRSLGARAGQAAIVAAFYAFGPLVARPRWASIVAALGGARWAYVLGVTLVNLATLVAGNAFFAVLYAAGWPSIEAYKSSPGAWPWARGPADAAAFRARLARALGLSALNVALTVPLAAGAHAAAVFFGYRADEASFPSVPLVFASIVGFSLIEDTMFYWTHRTLHHPSVYRHVHKVHHAFVDTVAPAAIATHPLEYAVGNALPFSAGPVLAGAHLYTLFAWTVYRVGETVFTHSGYALPASPFELLAAQGSAEDHDAHHARQVGNYSSLWTHWDRAMGTALARGEGEGEGGGRARRGGVKAAA